MNIATMRNDYNAMLSPNCCVFDNPFMKCVKCGATCTESDLDANGVCCDCNSVITVYDHIANLPLEEFAEKFIYTQKGLMDILYRSSIIEDKYWCEKADAVAATVQELKKEHRGFE